MWGPHLFNQEHPLSNHHPSTELSLCSGQELPNNQIKGSHIFLLWNKKSAPFDKLKAAPIRLSSRQALAHKKKQSLLFIQKQKITKPPNHQTTKSSAVTFLFLRKKSAPFDKLKAAPIRLSSRQALAHKKSSHFYLFRNKKSPNHQIIKPPNQEQLHFYFSETKIST
ncbi:MAG: hypothetical protein IPN13_03960 [Bacteroidetes bacterium]|nr:hypothetical protein [Bacteroidota bacterium]